MSRKESIPNESGASGNDKKPDGENKGSNQKPAPSKGKGNEKSGWFGGLFKNIIKGPNQMILPDDKNPTVI